MSRTPGKTGVAIAPTVTAAHIETIRASVVRTAMACFLDDKGSPIRAFPHQRLMVFVMERDYLGHALIIAPPGFAKTWWTNFYVASRIGRNPNLRVAYISNTALHATKQSKMIRDAISDNADFRSVFPDLLPNYARGWGENAWYVQRSIRNLNDPTFYACGVAGALIGARVDLMVWDDVNSEDQQNSPTQREKCSEWCANTAISRLVPDTGRCIDIQTRWHQEDEAGWCIQNGWTVLHLKAMAEDDGADQWATLTVYTAERRDHLAVDLLKEQWRFEVEEVGSVEHGDLRYAFRIFLHADGPSLWPERFSAKNLKEVRAHRTRRMWAAMFQGLPSPEGGAVIPVEHFVDYAWEDRAEREQPWVQKIQAWDTAFSLKTAADYSVCVTLGLARNGRMYLLDIFRKRVDFPALKQELYNQFVKHQPSAVLVEDRASGQSLVQEMQRTDDFLLARIPVIAIKPDRDKLSRAYSITSYIDAGKVLIPDKASFIDEFKSECALFPNGAHDDQVDAFVYAMQRLVLTNAFGAQDEEYFDNVTVLGDVRSREF